MRWRRSARILIAAIAVVCAIGVGVALRPRTTARVDTPVARTDPAAVVESAGGQTIRLNREHEEIRIAYNQLLSYANGTSKMLGVTVITERAGGRIFTITGKEGEVGDQQSTVALSGDVHMTASDGMELTTDRATYTEADGIVRAPGDVRFSRGRMSGSGTGFTFDKNSNVLTIGDRASVHVDSDAGGAGAMHVDSGGLQFARNERLIRFERTMKATRAREVIEAALAVAHLSADEQRIETLELRNGSRITATHPAVGELQELTGRDIDLQYGPDGQAIQHAAIMGDASVQLAGDAGQPGRQITANTIDVGLANDGAIPTLLTARDNVRLTIPGDANTAARTISAQALDSSGDPPRGLSKARFSRSVQFTERGAEVNRTARSNILDIVVAPGFSSIDEARFSQAVRFVDGDMTATAAAARYVLAKGTLELSGSDPANPKPHVENPQLTIDAAHVDIALDGPVVNAAGMVKSVIRPQKDRSRIPSMLKQDQPVNVIANELAYDGHASRAMYSGSAQLWQGETTIKAGSITIDSKNGNLSADGAVTTTSVMLQDNKDGKKERVRSLGSAKEFAYDDTSRKATYSGDAHLTGSQGDTTATRIELYLTESGDEVQRAEAYETVTLRDQNRKTTGARLTYHSADERYVVTGTPVSIVDECGRETIARTLTFFRTTDRIIVDGDEQVRTQTKGKSNCS